MSMRRQVLSLFFSTMFGRLAAIVLSVWMGIIIIIIIIIVIIIIITIFFVMKQFGSSKTFSLLKGSMGRFNDFLSRCEEDVIVLAHTHTWKEDEIKGTKNGGSMYVNTGTWIDFAHDVSTLTPSLCSLDGKKNFSCLICAALPSPFRERWTSAGSFPEQRLLPWSYLIKYNIQRF